MSLTEEDRNWIVGELAKLRVELRADIERTETTLLTEWASPIEARMRTHTATMRAIDLEYEALADRVTKLEPPH